MTMISRRAMPLAGPTIADIQAAVARGKADVEAGRVVDAEQAFAELEAHFRALAKSAAEPD